MRTTIAILALSALALTGCGDSGDDAATPVPTAPSTATTSAASTTSATSSPSDSPTPDVIAYAGGESSGAEIHSLADARKLTELPTDFQDFIGGVADKLVKKSTCADAAVGVTLEFFRTDGYASGGVNECGGYQALWAKVDGAWKEIGGTQDMWTCGLLAKYSVPSDVAGQRCYDKTSQKVVRYHQA